MLMQDSLPARRAEVRSSAELGGCFELRRIGTRFVQQASRRTYSTDAIHLLPEFHAKFFLLGIDELLEVILQAAAKSSMETWYVNDVSRVACQLLEHRLLTP